MSNRNNNPQNQSEPVAAAAQNNVAVAKATFAQGSPVAEVAQAAPVFAKPIQSEEQFERELRADLIEARNGGPMVEVAGQSSDVEKVMPLKEALKSNVPDARMIVANDAMARNRFTKQAREKKFFLVDDSRIPVQAFDKIEALAVHNDREGKWPTPQGRHVREVRPMQQNERPEMAAQKVNGFEFVS